MKSELDLFSVPAIQTNVLKTEEVSYKPIATLTNSSVFEFVSLGHGDTYRDLSSIYLRLLLKIKKSPTEDYTATPPATNTSGSVGGATPFTNDEDSGNVRRKRQTGSTGGGVVNNLLHSLFRQCTIYLNGKPVAQTDNNYSFRAYIETLLNYGNDASTTHLESFGWFLDTHGEMDNLVHFKNIGLDKLREVFGKSATIELIGKIHGDMLNQPKLLLNNIDLRVVLCLEKPEFYILEEDT